ncbi:MAG: hypothetical protein IPO16_02860 [Saprospiraceae bacterium]|nr:hypothetical protein [Saprospiraceae bacterium]
MRTLFYLLIIVFIINLFSACQGKKSQDLKYYPNGSVMRKTNLIDHKKEGEMIEYYNDGKVKSICLFENDLQTGRCIYYFQSGAIQEIQYYESDKQQSGDTIFYENGRYQLIMNFKDGIKHGAVQKYDTIGEMYFHAKYNMDTLIEVNGVPLAK